MPPKQNIVHFPVGIAPVHINYRLHGSIPAAVKRKLALSRAKSRADLEQRLQELPTGLHHEAYTQEMAAINRRYEAEVERVPHQPASGPMFLDQPPLRKIIIDSWKFLQDRGELVVHAVCVMSNHVHVIVSNPPEEPLLDTGALMDRHKTFTARLCNQELNRSGTSFWAPKYFDRTVRQGAWLTAMWYVLNNPVKAGLVESWLEWPGIYLNPRYASHFME